MLALLSFQEGIRVKTRVRVSQFVSVLALVGLVLTMAMGAPLLGNSPVAAQEGNSQNAQLCQKGGWQNLQNSDGIPFSSQGECVASGAQGNGVAPIPTVTISFSFYVGGYCTGYAYLTGFAPNTSFPYAWSWANLNNGATGGPYTGSLWTNDQGTASLGSWFPPFLLNVSTLTVTVGGVTAGPVTATC